MSEMDDIKGFWKQFEQAFHAKKGSEELHQMLSKKALNRPIRPEEVYYLLSRYAYLDIEHPEGSKPLIGRSKKIITIEQGWDVHDYGDRVLSSAGKYCHGRFNQDSQGSDLSSPTIGTLLRQSVVTANFMVNLAIEKNWPSIQVKDGFYSMVRAAWVAAESQHIELKGYTPADADRVVYSWAHSVLNQSYQSMVNPKPTK